MTLKNIYRTCFVLLLMPLSNISFAKESVTVAKPPVIGPVKWPKPRGVNFMPLPELEIYRLNLEDSRKKSEFLRDQNPSLGLPEYQDNLNKYKEGMKTYKDILIQQKKSK